MVPGRFAREWFRPWVVSPVGCFALGRFALGRFARELFRPYLEGHFALISLTDPSKIVGLAYLLLILMSFAVYMKVFIGLGSL